MDSEHQQPNETNYLRTLLQLGALLNASLSVVEVLQTAIDEVVKFAGAERGFILLVDEGAKRVVGMASSGIDRLELESVLSGRDRTNVPRISRTIVDEALRDSKLVLSTNAMEDPRYSSRTSVQL